MPDNEAACSLAQEATTCPLQGGWVGGPRRGACEDGADFGHGFVRSTAAGRCLYGIPTLGETWLREPRLPVGQRVAGRVSSASLAPHGSHHMGGLTARRTTQPPHGAQCVPSYCLVQAASSTSSTTCNFICMIRHDGNDALPERAWQCHPFNAAAHGAVLAPTCNSSANPLRQARETRLGHIISRRRPLLFPAGFSRHHSLRVR